MKLTLCFLLIPIFQLSHNTPLEPSLSNDEKEALELITFLNTKMNEIMNRNSIAEWAYGSNITDENEKHKNEIQTETAEENRQMVAQLQKYNWKEFKNEDLKRQYRLSTKLGYAILSDSEYKDLLENLSKMEGNYAKVKICSYLNRTKCDLSLEPDIENIIVNSRDPEELKFIWTQWYDKAGTPVRHNFERYIELKTKAALLNNYTSAAEQWLDKYEDSTFENQIENVLTGIKPFYEHLHGYVRWRLRQKYGDTIVSEKGPIPMHLLGNMWGQTWGEIADIVVPFPNKPLVNVNDEMKAQAITPLKMFQMGDDFFQSINMTKLPQTFWDKSILEKPNDGRELVCHASAWDFFIQDDVRIKQCTEVTQEQLSTVHHELGHIQYYLQYQHLPHVYRTGANPGFHEAVGDVIGLSVSTPKHLEKIGLLKNYQPDSEARINQLFLKALDKISLLPFAYVMDKYRYQILRNELKPNEWNCGFWKLRDQYSGIEPPVQRNENDFDPPAKYHISTDVEYLRYFVSFIIQFQFYKAACIKAGKYEPGNPALPLDNCDFYNSPEAGNAFKAMLSLGASKPWPDAMELFTGERIMSSSALLEYFDPLINWLKVENEKNKIHIGWEKSDKCGTINSEPYKGPPRLEILPKQDVQRKPVGRSLMLTCRAAVDDASLITDLQWRDPMNNTVLAKSDKYTPLYDTTGRIRNQITSSGLSPPMYTELLPGDNLALIIPSLQDTMGGRYYCTASYANTDMLETSVQVETFVAITWTDAPLKQYPILGSNYKVKCKVTANPSPSVDWLRNEDPIRTGTKYVIEPDGLLIKNVQESDDGFYTCRAFVMQTGDLDERHIRVEVYIKPVIHDLKPEYKAIDGQSFSASCNATGKPVPEISWVKEQSQQNVATADRFQVDSQTGRLTITHVEKEDHGVYICMARNAAGVAEERTKISVQIKPEIFEFYNGTVILGKEVAITCRSKGRPAPEITFKRWGSDDQFIRGAQPDDDRIILEQHFDQEAGESSGTLRITNSLRNDDGLYQCIAKNQAKTEYKTGHIQVEYPPDFDHMKEWPPVFSWEEKPVNLTCLAMGIPNATIEWRWNGRPVKDLVDKNLEIIGAGPESKLLVRPSHKNYYSVYKCVGTNKHGQSEIDIQLKEARLPEYVTSARVKLVTATTISFEIISPPFEKGLPILSYNVQYKEENGLSDWNHVPSRTFSVDSPYVVEGLKPQTSYLFRFAASNIVGTGNWGATVQQTTPKRSAPEEPKVLHSPVNDDENEPIVVSPYSDHFELRWNVPADNGEPIDFYQVKFCPGQKLAGTWNENEQHCRSRDVIETTTFEMSQLSGNTYYRIELRAHNAIGFSTPANLYMKTARGTDTVIIREEPVLTSAAIVGISIAGIIILLIIIDFFCCLFLSTGILASICRKKKRSPSELDDEAKLGSLYGWRFPLPYCSGQMVKEPPPSPLPLPPPVKLGGSPMASPLDEKQPLNTPTGSIKKNSSVEFDGRFVHSRSGDIIGKNSAV